MAGLQCVASVASVANVANGSSSSPPPPEASCSPGAKSSPERSPAASPARQRRDSDRYCQLCNAWFNNPGMAQQHYDGKKHKKNAARADLLEQLGHSLDMGHMKGRARL